MTNTYLNNKYTVQLIDEHPVQSPFGFRANYDVLITNTITNKIVIIEDYTSSPLHTTDSKRTDTALSMILGFATEWRDTHRNDNDPDEEDNIFETTYNQLSSVMSDEDMDELQLYFYDLETQE